MTCKHVHTKVVDSRTDANGYRRRRYVCRDCKLRWSTIKMPTQYVPGRNGVPSSGDNSIGAKEQVKRLMAECDEWRRRAELLWEELGYKGAYDFIYDHPEAAQWFEEN